MGKWFQPDKAGIREIFRSEGMRAVLAEVSKQKSDEANRLARAQSDSLGLAYYEKPPYEPDVALLDNTYVGGVSTAHKLGAIDQEHNQTLDAINH